MSWFRGVLFSFQFWDEKQNLVPNMWQVVFANVSIEGRVVDFDVSGFIDLHEVLYQCKYPKWAINKVLH